MKPVTIIFEGKERPLYVLRRVSDKSIINPSTTSNTIDTPNPGPDQEYLPIMVDDIPDYDPTFSILTKIEGVNENSGQWEITYTIEDKPTEDILTYAQNVAAEQAAIIVPPDKSTEMIVGALAAIINAAGLAFAAEDKVFIDSILDAAQKLADNSANLTSVQSAINAGSKPNLKTSLQVNLGGK